MIGAAFGREKAGSGALPAAVAGVGLALLNWHLLVMPIDTAPIVPPVPDNMVTASSFSAPANGEAAVSAAAFPATLARPLFRSDRRPAEAAKQQTAQARPSRQQMQARLPDGLTLVGIVKEGAEPGRALIRSAASDTGHWVEVGYVLDGWRLSRIEAGSILFETEGRKQTLSLFPQKPE
jgi:hypothetical protein